MKTNWKTKKLGEVLKLEYGKPLSKSMRVIGGKYPVYGANGERERSNNYLYSKRSIIVGRKGSAGELNITEEKFWPLDVTYFVTFDERKYDLKFLYDLLVTLELPRLAKGVKPGLNRNEVYSIEVGIPELSEQKRIAKKLDNVFDKMKVARENADKNLQNSKELFESYLQSVFTNSKKEWEEKRLNEICNIIGGGTPSKTGDNFAKFYNGDIPWATVRDMRNSIIHETEHQITQEAVKNSSTNIISKNNVVIATRVGLGKICLLAHNTAINQDLRGIIPINPKNLEVKYLFWWFNSISKIIIENGSGATVHGVKLPFIKGLAMPLPSLSEQQAIVKKLDALSLETKKLEKIYKQKLVDLEELKKSILQKAFRGEL